jgi:RNA polymerase sigma factor (sigma-70 family)
MTRSAASLSEIEAAYRAHAQHVARRAARILGEESDAREVVQEVFMSLIDHPEQFAGKSSLTTWLYSVTTHSCLNRLRNQRTRAALLATQSGALPLPAQRASPDRLLELRELLVRLPEELAQVAVLLFADEMSQHEIAEVMACSRRHVRTLVVRLERALSAVREAAP